MLYLPSYAATAFYHKNCRPTCRANHVERAEKLAVGARHWPKGDNLTDADYKSMVAKLARITGVDQKYVDNSDLRMG